MSGCTKTSFNCRASFYLMFVSCNILTSFVRECLAFSDSRNKYVKLHTLNKEPLIAYVTEIIVLRAQIPGIDCRMTTQNRTFVQRMAAYQQLKSRLDTKIWPGKGAWSPTRARERECTQSVPHSTSFVLRSPAIPATRSFQSWQFSGTWIRDLLNICWRQAAWCGLIAAQRNALWFLNGVIFC